MVLQEILSFYDCRLESVPVLSISDLPRSFLVNILPPILSFCVDVFVVCYPVPFSCILLNNNFACRKAKIKLL